MHSNNDYREAVRVARLIGVEDQRVYSVFGQFLPSVADPTVFVCSVTRGGGLVCVDKP